MIVPGTLAALRPVFISFSSKDLKLATTICHAIESRGAACWISNRDVKGGENFQEAIISAIHDAKIMVLVFSSNTNNSGEIKKELAIASQHGLVVIPVRIEDVLPSGAFAYELSTRQWVDLFQDWEIAMESLTGRIASVLGTSDVSPMRVPPEPLKNGAGEANGLGASNTHGKVVDKGTPKSRSTLLIAGALGACVALFAGGFYYYQHVTCCAPPPAVHQPEAASTDMAPPNKPGGSSGQAARSSESEHLPSDKKPVAAAISVDSAKTGPTRAAEAVPSKPQQHAEDNSAAFNLAVHEGAQAQPVPNEGKLAPSNDGTAQKADTQQEPAPAADAVVASREPQDTDQSMSQDDRAARKRAPQPLTAPMGPPPQIADVGVGGQVFRECTNCPAMVVIPAGANWIGSTKSQSGHDSSEEPRREISFKQPFALGRDAVTYAEWDACVAEGGCNHFLPGDMGWGRGQQPVVLVSWEDAKAYTDWLSQKTGATYRLPFEAEWEYAARACRLAICQDQIFWFGNRINPDRANYDWRYSYAGSQKAQALGKPKPAGTDGPNPFGLFNAVGNVAQWVEDCWNDNLKTLPADGSARLSGDCTSRVFRGGSWHDEPVDLRSASRKSDLSNSRQPFIGFRVARVLTE